MLRDQCLDLQTDQSVQAHFQDSGRLALGKPEQGCHLLRDLGLESDIVRHAVYKTGACILDRLTSPQDLNDQIDHIAGFDQPFLDLALLLLFRKESLIFAGRQLELEVHMVLNDLLKSQRLRASVCHGEHIYAEGVLQAGLLVEHVL